MMTNEQMEEAVEEAREILARHAAGTFEPDIEEEYLTGHRTSIERLLAFREAWLQGQVIKGGEPRDVDSEEALAIFQSTKEGARMLTKADAIAYLRGINSLNHEPLRPVEQAWLDRVFIRERMSKGAIGLAAVLASDEEQGIHIGDDCSQSPCNCPDKAPQSAT